MRRTKKLAAVAAGLLLIAGMAGCSSSTAQGEAPQEEVVETVDLSGDWTEVDGDPENYQEATISGDTIEIYWVSPDTKALYWAGDVVVPEGEQSFAWESKNDTSKTDSAILASTAESKEFSFADDQITYEVTAMGVTKTVTLGR